MKRKPLYPSNLSPLELIGGDNNYKFLKMHFKACLKIQDPEKFDSTLSKKFKEDERVLIAGMYKRLSDFGIYAKCIDKDGEIEWGITVRGDLQEYVESMPLVSRGEYAKGQEVPF